MVAGSGYEQFAQLVINTRNTMNEKALIDPSFYRSNDGKMMENIVCEELSNQAIGTMFENRVHLVKSIRSFPDIIVGDIFGVEVKTSKSGWKSLGSSIMESTRTPGIKHIEMFFGKMYPGNVEFNVKPYERCLSNIGVTHSPRYDIDMTLGEGDTIFEKMDIPYDDFRNHPEPVEVLKSYYRPLLSQGQTLWWMGNDSEEATSPPILKMWNSLNSHDEERFTAKGFVFFPELIAGNSKTKYTRMVFWLVTKYGIINHALRDKYSGGGRKDFVVNGIEYRNRPKVLYILNSKKDLIKELILQAEPLELQEHWQTDYIYEGDQRIQQWIELVSLQGDVEVSLLKNIFAG